MSQPPTHLPKMPTNPKPTIVLVPGSFATPDLYSPIVTLLRQKGHPALAIGLPSTQKRAGLPPATMQEDATHIRAVAETLLAQGKDVVVVCHSYGGVPTTEALAGVPVKRIVYLTAVAPRVGEAQMDTFEGGLVRELVEGAVNGYMHITDAAALAGAIGNDLASWEYAYECALKLSHHSAVSFTEPLTKAGYKDVPVSYLLTEKDLIIPPSLQQKYIDNIEEAQGKKIDVVRQKDWGHCPTWSFPEELVEVLVGEAEK